MATRSFKWLQMINLAVLTKHDKLNQCWFLVGQHRGRQASIEQTQQRIFTFKTMSSYFIWNDIWAKITKQITVAQ